MKTANKVPAKSSAPQKTDFVGKTMINRAFKLMRESGLHAETSYAWYKTCSRTVTFMLMADKPCLGYAYLHWQEEGCHPKGEGVEIGYGGMMDTNCTTHSREDAGKAITECLRKAGVPYTMGEDSRILVPQGPIPVHAAPTRSAALKAFSALKTTPPARLM
jgi:hypothetical protein